MVYPSSTRVRLIGDPTKLVFQLDRFVNRVTTNNCLFSSWFLTSGSLSTNLNRCQIRKHPLISSKTGNLACPMIYAGQ
jgi:hypothetical protein